MLTRRRLFGLFLGAPAVAVAADTAMSGICHTCVVGKQEDRPAPDEFSYRGYAIKWTGWKHSQDSINICAQWVAYNLAEGRQCYSATGVVAEKYNRGDMFNISVLDRDAWADITTRDDHLAFLRKRSLDRLISLLRKEVI